MKPAVVLKSKFVVSNDKAFNDYINYIDRDGAKQVIDYTHDFNNQNDFTLFHSFMDYMGNEEKEGELFNKDANSLDKKEKGLLKEGFSHAQGKGSPMWQDVISFDNEWLEEQGLYDSTNHELNEDKIKDVTRKAVEELARCEGLEMETILWSGAIHYNTDNIHVHVAMVQPNPTVIKKEVQKGNGEYVEEYRGKRKQKSLNRMKSKVANEIVDRNKEYERIDKLIRNPVRAKSHIDLSVYDETKDLFIKALPLLPDKMSEWRYGYASVDDARPFIDEIGKIYLEEFHGHEMEELYKELDKQVELTERLFGSGSNYDRYKDNKLEDLRTRMGNAILTEMREFHKDNRTDEGYTNYIKNYNNKDAPKRKQARKFVNSNFKNNIQQSIYTLNRVMRKSFHEHKKDRNISEFDRMLEGYE